MLDEMLDSWPGSGRRAGDRFAEEGLRDTRRDVVVVGPAGIAGWMEGKLMDRSEAGVRSSRMAPVELRLAAADELCCDDRRERSPWPDLKESSCSCWSRIICNIRLTCASCSCSSSLWISPRLGCR
jgi:hypothetical protein